MSEIDLPRPNGICPACQESAPVLKHDATGRLAIYCEHNRAGAFLGPATDGSVVWLIYTPVDADEFAGSLVRFAERFAVAFGSGGEPQH